MRTDININRQVILVRIVAEISPGIYRCRVTEPGKGYHKIFTENQLKNLR